MKDDRLYLDHILDCIQWLQTTAAEGRDVFLTDRKTRDAMLRNLQVLAESTQKLSPELKQTHPEIFWDGIAGFRNVLVHDYLGLKPERVWEIVERDLPELQRAVERMLKDLANS